MSSAATSNDPGGTMKVGYGKDDDEHILLVNQLESGTAGAWFADLAGQDG